MHRLRRIDRIRRWVLASPPAEAFGRGAAMKMYILVRDDVPLGFAMVAVAHASLAAYLAFRDTAEVEEWLSGPFLKAVCMVNAKEFQNARAIPDHVVLTESALGNREVAIAFKPRKDWPKMFRFLRLYRDPPSASPTDGVQP